MFAFSETIWEPRAEFYLEKSISKLKEKEWGSIMDAAAEYSTIKFSSAIGKKLLVVDCMVWKRMTRK
jgi:hypothetical protein